MELDVILDGIRTAGQQQILQIEQEAEKQTSQILTRAQSDADLQRNRILADGRARLNREKALVEQQSVIQALQIHADARQSLIERALKKVTELFSNLRGKKEYEKILMSQVEEAIHSIRPSLVDHQKIILHFDPRDRETTENISKKFPEHISIQYDLNCFGGCSAETEDGMVRALNTIESRFQHALPYIQQDLSLFFERKSSAS